MRRAAATAFVFSLLLPTLSAAGDRLCDTAFEDCRAPLLDLILNEHVGIDVAFWFMEDARYTAALERKIAEGVAVRVLMDTRANSTYPLNAQRLAELREGGIPMRRRVASGILHWKMMLFEGQDTVQFSAANYTSAFVPNTPYRDYVDEAVYFSDDPAVVNSFRTKYDDLWTDESRYADYANVQRPLTRRYGLFPKEPELNFPPLESYRNRAVGRYNAETEALDVIMYRITDRAHTDAMIRAMQRGVPVRLITEPQQYRDPTRYWHSWNVDRLYAAGAQIRHRAHAGLNHQKSVLLRSQAMTIFGSSNWTSPSSSSQEEHNYFTVKPYFFDWFTEHFDRKWNNSTGNAETAPFVPLPPDAPRNIEPGQSAALSEATSATLVFNAGIWAHLYDIYFGATPTPPLLAADQPLGPSVSSSDHRRFTVSGLTPGTMYYWRIVAKTMANQTNAGPIWSLTIGGTPPTGDGDIVLHSATAGVLQGNWTVVPDSTAAGGSRLANPDAGLGKVTPASAAPVDYFEITFEAEAGRPYHLWMRGRAERDYYGNDSVHVQFNGSLNSAGGAAYRIGTTSSLEVCIEDGNGAGLAGWGWQDNGWGTLGAHVYFAGSGPQTMRVQRREDGISIDQIVLSPGNYLQQSPGATKHDTTILDATGGGDGEEPPASDDVIVYASEATITGNQWALVADSAAASGTALLSIDNGVPKVPAAAASPPSYADIAVTVEAGRGYRLWMRGRADSNYWGNDSLHVQVSGAVDADGAPVYQIGTPESAVINLEDCNGCGIRGWGWQDTGWGRDVLGPLIYFATPGDQTLRVQIREDGFRIDQIVLSPDRYVHQPPGALKDDATILER